MTNGNIIKQVSPSEIELFTDEHGHPLNPRGPVRDTSDLQMAIRGAGRIVVPLVCTAMPGGTLYLLNGHRRLVAAKALKLATVPVNVIELMPGENPIDIMLTTDVSKEFPAVVLDKEGAIIGGIAKAVSHRIDIAGGKTLESLADTMGMRPDFVSAYHRLFYAPVEVRRAVANGKLSITAFARMKHASGEAQKEIVNSADGGKVSVSRVRGHLKRARQKAQPKPLIPDAVLEATTAETERETETGTEIGTDKPADRLAALNRMLRALKSVDPDTLDPRERYVWDQIVETVLDTELA